MFEITIVVAFPFFFFAVIATINSTIGKLEFFFFFGGGGGQGRVDCEGIRIMLCFSLLCTLYSLNFSTFSSGVMATFSGCLLCLLELDSFVFDLFSFLVLARLPFFTVTSAF